MPAFDPVRDAVLNSPVTVSPTFTRRSSNDGTAPMSDPVPRRATDLSVLLNASSSSSSQDAPSSSRPLSSPQHSFPPPTPSRASSLANILHPPPNTAAHPPPSPPDRLGRAQPLQRVNNPGARPSPAAEFPPPVTASQRRPTSLQVRTAPPTTPDGSQYTPGGVFTPHTDRYALPTPTGDSLFSPIAEYRGERATYGAGVYGTPPPGPGDYHRAAGTGISALVSDMRSSSGSRGLYTPGEQQPRTSYFPPGPHPPSPSLPRSRPSTGSRRSSASLSQERPTSSHMDSATSSQVMFRRERTLSSPHIAPPLPYDPPVPFQLDRPPSSHLDRPTSSHATLRRERTLSSPHAMAPVPPPVHPERPSSSHMERPSSSSSASYTDRPAPMSGQPAPYADYGPPPGTRRVRTKSSPRMAPPPLPVTPAATSPRVEHRSRALPSTSPAGVATARHAPPPPPQPQPPQPPVLLHPAPPIIPQPAFDPFASVAPVAAVPVAAAPPRPPSGQRNGRPPPSAASRRSTKAAPPPPVIPKSEPTPPPPVADAPVAQRAPPPGPAPLPVSALAPSPLSRPPTPPLASTAPLQATSLPAPTPAQAPPTPAATPLPVPPRRPTSAVKRSPSPTPPLPPKKRARMSPRAQAAPRHPLPARPNAEPEPIAPKPEPGLENTRTTTLAYNPRRRTPAGSVLVPLSADEIAMYRAQLGQGTMRLAKRKRPLDELEVAGADEGEGAPRVKRSRDTGLVAEHYNSRPNVGVEQRRESPIIGMRNFNNWIKSVIISAFAHPALLDSHVAGAGRGPAGAMKGKVLDMGCGKGGDLSKWNKARVREYVGLDLAAMSVDQARTRHTSLRPPRFDAYFAALDCFIYPLTRALPPARLVAPFDVVSMQFCMHYAFESLAKARMMLENVSTWLRTGGRMIGTIPNAEQLLARLDALPADDADLSFGNSVYRIKFDDRDSRPIYGHRYSFFLRDAVDDVPEYVVHWEPFVRLAAEYNLYPVYKKEFHEVFEEFKDHSEFEPLLQRMKVVDSKGETDMDEDQWEAANIYVAFALEKREKR